ncbi:MAG: lipid-A-disaccharide synthase [Candidatus Omnitrophica bacterium]|nr:lipid-A-disaccharide synthase [Candidatus Omnitrophota bacterium]
MPKSIIIIAGEPSADMHGAALTRALKISNPNLVISGIGGPQMREAGVKTFADLTQYAVIGFIEVLKHFSIFKKTFELTLLQIKKEQPQAVILIDYPGFNLRLAKRIKQDIPKVKVIYYISPQIWAWGKKRINLIKQTVDKMLVVFKFEETMYKENGIDAKFVGHPLLEKFKGLKEKKAVLESMNLSDTDKILSILPGSRINEVKKLLPVMLKGATALQKKMPEIKFLLIRALNINSDLIRGITHDYRHLNLKIIDKNTYDARNISSFAWVCSGTATLETAILGIPMLVVYKTSFLTWFTTKLLIELPYIGLVNVVAGKKIVPEFIQYHANPTNLFKATIDFFNLNAQKQDDIKQALTKVKLNLGTSDANKNAAQAIAALIN